MISSGPLPSELWAYVFDESLEELQQARLSLSLADFLRVVEKVDPSKPLSLSESSNARLLRLLKANAKHWPSVSPRIAGKSELYRWTARQSTGPGPNAAAAAKLLLAFTSNSASSDLQADLQYALEVIVGDLAAHHDLDKRTLFHLKTLLVIIDRIPTLFPNQVTATSNALEALALPALQQISINPRSRATPTATKPSASFLDSEASSADEGSSSINRRTTKHQIQLAALCCIESLATTRQRHFRTVWTQFIASEQRKTPRDLVHVAISDPALDLRAQAFKVLQAVFSDSEYLQIAQERDTQTTRGFKALSDTLASLVRLSCSRLVRSAPSSTFDLDLCLAHSKCTRTLVANVPWNRIRKDLPLRIWDATSRMLIAEEEPSLRREYALTLLSISKFVDEPPNAHSTLQSILSKSARTLEEWQLASHLAAILPESDQRSLMKATENQFEADLEGREMALLGLTVFFEQSRTRPTGLDGLLLRASQDESPQVQKAASSYLRFPSIMDTETYHQLVCTLLSTNTLDSIHTTSWTSLGAACTDQAEIKALPVALLMSTFNRDLSTMPKSIAAPYSWALACFWEFALAEKETMMDPSDFDRLCNQTQAVHAAFGSNQKVLVNLVRILAAMLSCARVSDEGLQEALQLFLATLSNGARSRAQGIAAAQIGCLDVQWSRLSHQDQDHAYETVVGVLSKASLPLICQLLGPTNDLRFLKHHSAEGLTATLKEVEDRVNREKDSLSFAQAQKIPQVLSKLKWLQEATGAL